MIPIAGKIKSIYILYSLVKCLYMVTQCASVTKSVLKASRVLVMVLEATNTRTQTDNLL